MKTIQWKGIFLILFSVMAWRKARVTLPEPWRLLVGNINGWTGGRSGRMSVAWLPLWRWGRGYMNNGWVDPKECVGGAYQASVILSISPLKGLEWPNTKSSSPSTQDVWAAWDPLERGVPVPSCWDEKTFRRLVLLAKSIRRVVSGSVLICKAASAPCRGLSAPCKIPPICLGGGWLPEIPET